MLKRFFLQRDRHRILLEHDAQRSAQRGHERVVARAQVLMLIGRQLAEAAGAGCQGSEVARDLQAQPIQILRMNEPAGDEVIDQRFVAVDGLEHEKVGNFSSPAAAGGDRARGERFAPLVQRPLAARSEIRARGLTACTFSTVGMKFSSNVIRRSAWHSLMCASGMQAKSSCGSDASSRARAQC